MKAPRLRLTASAIKSFRFCARKYYYEYERGIWPKTTPEPFIVGAYYHEGLSHLPDMKAALSAIPATTDLGILARFLVEQYAYRYQHEKLDILKNGAERIFFEPLSDTLEIAGKIDKVIKDEDGVWLLEHKTSSMIDPDYLSKVTLDIQLSMYLYALGLIARVPIIGAIYDVICKPTTYRRKDESMEEYLERCAPSYLVTPHEYFARQKAYRSALSLAAFREELFATEAAIRLYRERGCWPHQDAFYCFGRQRTCEYAMLCRDGENARTLMNYVTHAPFAELKGGDIHECSALKPKRASR